MDHEHYEDDDERQCDHDDDVMCHSVFLDRTTRAHTASLRFKGILGQNALGCRRHARVHELRLAPQRPSPGALRSKHGQDLLYLSGELSRLTRTSPQAVSCHGP
jgi:hypothetical protein